MRTTLDCYSCFFRQALQTARIVTDDTAIHEQVIREVCLSCAELDLDDSLPQVSQKIHRIIRKHTGDNDPYQSIKQRFNAFAVTLREELRPQVLGSTEPFKNAVRLAIAGNRIDYGAFSQVSEAEMIDLVSRAFDQPLLGEADQLQHEIKQAKQILFLADNAGEIALDLLLIEQIPAQKITVAVRGKPVLNDATLEDAKATGLTDVVSVIDNGSDAPGTILEDCSTEFVQAFNQADLIISKGQGNYESLSDRKDRNIYFLLIPKCELVADHIGYPEGSFVVRSSKEILS